MEQTDPIKAKTEELANKNPESVLDAVIDPAPLTIAQLAILEKMKSPILLERRLTFHIENVKATYAVQLSYREAAKAIKKEDFEETAMEWADSIGWKAYSDKFEALVLSLIAYLKMLPKAEQKNEGEGEGDGEKKNPSEAVS